MMPPSRFLSFAEDSHDMKKRIRDISLLIALTAAASIAAPPVASAIAQARRAMTFEDVMSLRVVSDPRISPAGKHVAFVVTQADMKTNFRNPDVWLVAADGGEPKQLTRSPKRDDQPRWSSDSRRLAFISDRDGKAQVFVLSIEGGEARKVTDVQTAVQSFEWSPDGKRIAYIAADPISEAREKEKSPEKGASGKCAARLHPLATKLPCPSFR